MTKDQVRRRRAVGTPVKPFFEPHELDVKEPGSLDGWAIDDLTDQEADDFMEALIALRKV